MSTGYWISTSPYSDLPARLPADLDYKRCTQCQRVRPISEFRVRKPSGRFAECRRCHSDRERRRLRKKAAQADHRQFVSKLNEICRAEREQVHQLAVELLEEFGGLENVIGLWMNAHDRSRPGSYTRVRTLMATFRLYEAMALDAERERKKREAEYPMMSDEQLETDFNRYLTELIADEPELAVKAAIQLGWEVIPPSDAQVECLSAG